MSDNVARGLAALQEVLRVRNAKLAAAQQAQAEDAVEAGRTQSSCRPGRLCCGLVDRRLRNTPRRRRSQNE